MKEEGLYYAIYFSLQSAISEITKKLDFTVCPKKQPTGMPPA
jgi:hypothetical protein